MSKTSKFIVPLHVNYAYLKCFHLNHHYPGLIPANQQYLKTNLYFNVFLLQYQSTFICIVEDKTILHPSPLLPTCKN